MFQKTPGGGSGAGDYDGQVPEFVRQTKIRL